MDIASSIKFTVICNILKDIKNANSIVVKRTIIDQYYKSFCKHRRTFRKLHDLSKDGLERGETSFYCVLRCLIPNCDRDRPAYGLQIPVLGRIYLQILQVCPESRDADILLGRQYTPVKGDYAEKIFRILKPRSRTELSNLTLKDVHQFLDTISQGNRNDTEKVITEINEKMSALEQMWFIRLLLKTMCLGISDNAILAVIHPVASNFLKSCQNLKLLCDRLADGKIEISSGVKEDRSNIVIKTNDAGSSPMLPVPATLFEHVQPQLCETFPGEIKKLMAQDVLYLETKMDGERFHIHYGAKRFKYYSRRGIDYTESFGANFEEPHTLSARLRDLIGDDLESFILDGEMMIWDVEKHCFHEKTENTDVKNLYKKSSSLWVPCFVVYDLLYLNGVSLLQLSYVQRRLKLNVLLKEKLGVLHIMKSIKITSPNEFQQLFQKALDKQEEGVILKCQTSLYHPGKRNNAGWIKVKADYFQGLTTEFDLLVIGGFYNRTKTFIESFLLGVLGYISADEYVVWSVGKVSNVLRRRDALAEVLRTRWRLLEEELPPMWFHYIHNNAEGRPDVWIDPKDSVILQIKSTDLHVSANFALSTALHFPRIMAWRDDKPWNECMSLEEFNTIQKKTRGYGVQKIVNRTVTLDDLVRPRTKPKSLTTAQKRKAALTWYENRLDETKITVSSHILEGFSICVISGSKEKNLSLWNVKVLVIKNGGKIVENPLPNDPSCIVVAGDSNYRLELLIKSEQYNIARLDWLIDFCELKRNDIRPSDMLVITPALESNFEENYE